MPGRTAILHSAMFACVVIVALSIQAIRITHAADECLAKPDGPAPQGQHWYYRIDHANNNRQCWRLGPEGLPVRKSILQSEDDAASRPDAQQQPRAPQTVVTPSVRAVHNAAPAGAANSIALAPPMLWPDPSRLPSPLPVPPQPPLQSEAQSQSHPQVQLQAEPQTAGADSALLATASAATPAVRADPSRTGSVHAGQPQRPVVERPSPRTAAPQQPNGLDRTTALLAVMFALLAVTGPILHFTHRQRQRRKINHRPPRWAPVTPLNTPAPRVRHTHAPDPASPYRPARRAAPPADQTNWRPAPDLHQGLIPAPDPRSYAKPAPDPVPPPGHPPDPNERLRHAFQQLADRMQTVQTPEARGAPRAMQQANIEMMKRAR